MHFDCILPSVATWCSSVTAVTGLVNHVILVESRLLTSHKYTNISNITSHVLPASRRSVTVGSRSLCALCSVSLSIISIPVACLVDTFPLPPPSLHSFDLHSHPHPLTLLPPNQSSRVPGWTWGSHWWLHVAVESLLLTLLLQHTHSTLTSLSMM